MLKKARKKKAQNGARPENGGLQLKASGSNTAVTVDAKSPLFPAPLFSSAGSELPSRRHRNWQLLPDKPAATASKTASSGKAVGGAGGALLKKGAQPQGERPRTAPTVLGKRGRASAARPRPSALDFGAATGAAGSASAGASTPGGALCSVENGEGGEGDDDAGIMAEYEWARKNHERHQQAAFMQVVVKSFMTEATLLDVLLPIDTSVRNLKLKLQEELKITPPSLAPEGGGEDDDDETDKSKKPPPPLLPGQVLRIGHAGDKLRSGPAPTDCKVANDDDSLQTTWLQSPSGKASVLKQKMKMAALKANAMVAFTPPKLRKSPFSSSNIRNPFSATTTTPTSRPTSAHAPPSSSSASRPSSAHLTRGASAGAGATAGAAPSVANAFSNKKTAQPSLPSAGSHQQQHQRQHLKHGPSSRDHSHSHKSHNPGSHVTSHSNSHKHHAIDNKEDDEGSTATPPPPLTEAEQFKVDQDAAAEEIEANRHRLLLWWEHWTLDDDHNHALDVFACLRNVSNDAEKQLSHMPSSFQEDIDTETEAGPLPSIGSNNQKSGLDEQAVGAILHSSTGSHAVNDGTSSSPLPLLLSWPRSQWGNGRTQLRSVNGDDEDANDTTPEATPAEATGGLFAIKHRPSAAAAARKKSNQPSPRSRRRAHLMELERLSHLTSDMNQGWEGARVLQGRLHKIRLTYCRPPLSGSLANANGLKFLTGLERLNLCGNHLRGPLPGLVLGRLFHLTQLNLSKNQLTGEIPKELSSCSSLIDLNLSHNQLTGELPPGLGLSLKHLHSLNLSYNTFTGKIPEEWASLSALTSIDLSRNKLSGWLPALLFEEWGRGTRLKQGGGSGAAAAGSGRARPVGGTAGVGAGRKGGDRDEDRFGRREDEEEGVIVGQGLRSLSLHHNHFNGALPDTLRVLKVAEYVLLNHNRFESDDEYPLYALRNFSPRLRCLHLQKNRFLSSAKDSSSGGGAGNEDDPTADCDVRDLPAAMQLALAKEELEDRYAFATILL